MCRACFEEHSSSAHQCSEAKKIVASDLLAVASIGKGSFGRVLQVQRKQTGEEFALKIMAKSPNRKKIIRAEKLSLADLSHPFVVKLYAAFQGQQYAYLLMENVRGTPLSTLIKEDPNGMSENKAKKIFSQVVLATSVLHEKNFGHRDLKPDNMLWNVETNSLKLIDFGYSCRTTTQFQPAENDFVDDLQHDPTDRNILRYTAVGTPLYAPPELLLSAFQGYDSKKMDIWSLGIILWELLMGKVPFNARGLPDYRTLLRCYKAGEHRLPWEVDSCRSISISEKAKDLIELMLKADYRERPSVKQVMSHPFFEEVNFNELLEDAFKRERIKFPSTPANNIMAPNRSPDATYPAEVSELFSDQMFSPLQEKASPSYYEEFDFLNHELFLALNPAY